MQCWNNDLVRFDPDGIYNSAAATAPAMAMTAPKEASMSMAAPVLLADAGADDVGVMEVMGMMVVLEAAVKVLLAIAVVVATTLWSVIVRVSVAVDVAVTVVSASASAGSKSAATIDGRCISSRMIIVLAMPR
jgi:hypothetical protein